MARDGHREACRVHPRENARRAVVFCWIGFSSHGVKASLNPRFCDPVVNKYSEIPVMIRYVEVS